MQIAKEPLGQKGARITSHIALPGRYVVYMPTLDHMGVSRKIASDEERQRLKRILQKARAGLSGGFIIRTAGEGKTEEDIAADMTFLATSGWTSGRKPRSARAPAAASRPGYRPARPARPGDRFLQIRLGGQRGRLREHSAIPAAVPAGRGSAREAVHAPGADLRRLQHFAGAREGAAAEGLAEIGRLYRDQPDRGTGGDRREHRQICGQVEPPRRHDRQDQHGSGEGDRAADPAARPGRDHRRRLHRHGRAQEPAEGDAGARGSHAHGPRAVQDSPVQRFWTGGDHAQAGEAEPGADAVRALPVCEGADTSRASQTIIGEILQEANKIARAVEGRT